MHVLKRLCLDKSTGLVILRANFSTAEGPVGNLNSDKILAILFKKLIVRVFMDMVDILVKYVMHTVALIVWIGEIGTILSLDSDLKNVS